MLSRWRCTSASHALRISTPGRSWFGSFSKQRKANPSKTDPRKSSDRRFDARHPDDIEDLEGPEVLMQAKMYTPESLRTDGLALNCKRMVDFGLHMPELMERYGRRAAELAASMKPSEYSRIMNAFAKAAYEHDRMLTAFTKAIPSKLPHFLPPDLSNVCNAYAKFRRREHALFRRFSLEMPHKLPKFEAHELRNVANSYARLSVQDDLLFDDIADEIMRRPEEFDGTSMMIIANAFAHFKIKKPRFWQVVTDWLMETYVDLSAKDVALVFNALSAVEYRQVQLIDTLLTYLLDGPATLTEELDAHGVSIALNGLARLRWEDNVEQVSKLADRATSFLSEYDAREVTQLLHASSVLAPLATSEALVTGLLSRAQQLVEAQSFNAQGLSLIVRSCSTLQQRDVPLLTQIAKAVPDHIADFTPQGLAMLVGGYARMDVRSEILFYLVAQEMINKMPLFTGQGIGIVLNAYGNMDIRNERLVLACRKQVRSLAAELSIMEINRIEKGFRALDALDERTEGLLRNLRQELSAAEGAVGQVTDPWEAEDNELLRRLEAEPKAEPRVESLASRTPRTSERQREAEEHRAEPEPTDGQPKEGESAESLDLWSLWTPGASVAGDEATSTKNLRAYLAKPAHVGRVPVVLDEEGKDDVTTHRGRGRRRQRQTIARSDEEEEVRFHTQEESRGDARQRRSQAGRKESEEELQLHPHEQAEERIFIQEDAEAGEPRRFGRRSRRRHSG